ncbi:MAG: hypothetical protein ACKVX7_11010 [Planctomycetota bacterium]
MCNNTEPCCAHVRALGLLIALFSVGCESTQNAPTAPELAPPTVTDLREEPADPGEQIERLPWRDIPVGGSLSEFVILEPPDPEIEVWFARGDVITASNPSTTASPILVGDEAWRDWQVEFSLKAPAEQMLAVAIRMRRGEVASEFAVYRVTPPVTMDDPEWRRLRVQAIGDRIEVRDLSTGTVLLESRTECRFGGFALYLLPGQRAELTRFRSRCLQAPNL